MLGKASNLVRRLPGVWSVARRFRTLLFPPPNRAVEDYATHLPVLIGLAQLVPIRHVIEFGCGEYSTIAFLKRAVFPHLVSLQSFETDDSWLSKVSALAGEDPRLLLKNTKATGIPGDETFRNESLDLAFIDDGLTAEQRAQTIQGFFVSHLQARVVAVHDFEIALYREMVPRTMQSFCFDGVLPWTGVIWRGETLRLSDLRRLNRLIRSASNRISVSDCHGWLESFHKEGFPSLVR